MKLEYDMGEWRLVRGDWTQEDRRRFTRHGGEEEITVHAVSMQDGTWTGLVVHEVVDSPTEYREFEGRDVEAMVNGAIRDLLGGPIESLPWNMGSDARAYQETWQAIDEAESALSQLETDFGALPYAQVANRACAMLGFPTTLEVEVPEDAKDATNSFVNSVVFDESPDSGKALYRLVINAYDQVDVYENQYDRGNVTPLVEHIRRLRSRWRDNRN